MVAFAAALTLLAAVPSAFASRYVIKPVANDNLCLTPTEPGNGRPVIVGDCTGDLIYWTVKGNTLVNGNATAETAECLDQRDGITKNGNPFQVWQCYEGNTHQEFKLVYPTTGQNDSAPTTPTPIRIQWKDQPYCLDLTDGKAEANTTVQAWRCVKGGNPNQQWNFYDVTEAAEELAVDDQDDSAAVYNAALAAVFAPAAANATEDAATEQPAQVRRRHQRRITFGSH